MNSGNLKRDVCEKAVGTPKLGTGAKGRVNARPGYQVII